MYQQHILVCTCILRHHNSIASCVMTSFPRLRARGKICSSLSFQRWSCCYSVSDFVSLPRHISNLAPLPREKMSQRLSSLNIIQLREFLAGKGISTTITSALAGKIHSYCYDNVMIIVVSVIFFHEDKPVGKDTRCETLRSNIHCFLIRTRH